MGRLFHAAYAPGREDAIGRLLAVAVALAFVVARPSVLAQASAASTTDTIIHHEVTITATRESDAALTAKVQQALEDDPGVYVPHISVVTENGIVRLEGLATDAHDLNRALRLARRIAGKAHVVNDVDLWVVAEDNDK